MTAALPTSRATVVVVALLVVSFVTGLLLLAIGPRDADSAGADAYSKSAVGHRAFVEMLEGLGVPVAVSRFRTEDRAGPGSLLVLLEPRAGTERPGGEPDRLHELLAHAGPVLVVLAKRDWEPDPQRRGWVRRADAGVEAAAGAVLRRLGLEGGVEIDRAPSAWTVDRLGARPDLPDGAQTIAAAPGLEPWVASGDRVLVGRLWGGGERRFPRWVVADADLVESHGLHRGENALLVARLVEEARPSGGVVVVDETIHGHERRPLLWSALFRWPLVLPVGTGLLACLLWVAAGSVRFGAPRPAGPAVQPGSRFLVENSADLLRLGGHAAHALDRYLATSVQQVARATHAPSHLSPRELRDWISGAAAARRVGTGLEDVESAVRSARGTRDRRRVLEAAVLVHDWREEMTHGPRGHS